MPGNHDDPKKNIQGFLKEPSPERFEAVLASITDGVFTIDKDWRITCFNRAASEITGYARDEVMGKQCYKVLQSNICPDACAMRYTMDTGRPVTGLVVQLTSKERTAVPVSISTALFKDRQGAVIGGVETFRDLRQIQILRKEVDLKYSFEDIIGKSVQMRRLLDILPTVAESGSNVLLCGESGTGKELFARAIHNLSKRKNGPFIAFNCANYPDTLIDSELFGHEKGAFTGAVKTHKGRFARAQDGTLFLDEIGDLPQTTQAKLLRVLQEKIYEPLGSDSFEKTNARIVSATNRNLETMVGEGSFRRDLFYRINVIRLDIPPLRERIEDIPLLVRHFIGKLNVMHDKFIEGVSPKAMKLIMSYQYPGNVRELENIIEHGYVLSSSAYIGLKHIPEKLLAQSGAAEKAESLSDCERKVILDALKKSNNSRLEAARLLGMHKSTFFRKVKRLGIDLSTLKTNAD
ncbi:MAG: PAS domain-containing protein [Deltaproteobacteria bacterium]|nr:PAS domain-containing protein [Deltaproteobacteria bacterium]